jgi:TPR repeat protein
LSFVITIWQMPPGAAAPANIKEADALVEQQLAAPLHPSPVFRALGEALYARFPPSTVGFGANDAWLDSLDIGDHDEGPTLNIGLNTSGHHFNASYQHAVVQARRLGLNLYDPQTGEHHLADGRRLPEGEPPFDEISADAAWRASDWKAAILGLRSGVEVNLSEGIHDFARALQEGLGMPRQLMLAGALMQIAAAPDDARRRQRLAALKAWPADLRDRQAALRDRLRAAPSLLSAIDVEMAATEEIRKPLRMMPWTTGSYDHATWWLLREQAEDGDNTAAQRIAHADGPIKRLRGNPPWVLQPDDYHRYLRLAADRGDEDALRSVIEGLLSGRDGWPLDPRQALHLMRKAAVIHRSRWLGELAGRLASRFDAGWDPKRDRPQAEQLLKLAAVATGEDRLAFLRRACELDHPEAWRQLGNGYLRGDMGLPTDAIVGAALYLFAQKDLSSSGTHVGRWPLDDKLGIFERDDALWICHALIGEADPWRLIERAKHKLDHEPRITVALGQDMKSRVQVTPGRKEKDKGSGEGARVAAVLEAVVGARADEAARGPSGRASGLPASGERAAASTSGGSPWVALVLLLGGVLGQLLVLAMASGMSRGNVRLGLISAGACAVIGAWRFGGLLEWPGARRLLVTVAAAVPGVGLFAAGSVLRAAARRGADATEE